jgi:DNA-binding NarL/FixJ family response regulator
MNQKASAPRNATVFIVDDHPIVRQALSQLINQETGLTVCGDAETLPQALSRIGEAKPDLVIVDISLRGASGIELIKSLKTRYPDLSILVLSMHDESLFAERALRSGAMGYITKQEATEKVLTAIRRVLSGEIYLSEQMASRMLRKMVAGRDEEGGSVLECLSNRELQVFELIGHGKATREIANDLHVSVKTVETHRARIKEKLQLKTAAELIQHAVQWVHSENG